MAANSLYNKLTPITGKKTPALQVSDTGDVFCGSGKINSTLGIPLVPLHLHTAVLITRSSINI